MEKIINGKSVHVNEEGYLTDFNEWDVNIASELAKAEGIQDLSTKHMEIIQFLQDQNSKKIPLTIRKVGSSGVTDIKEFYSLFPGGPLKKASKIAGIPKPLSCI